MWSNLKVKAEVAHLVEHQPSKLRVAGSSPVFRSKNILKNQSIDLAEKFIERVQQGPDNGREARPDSYRDSAQSFKY